MAEAETDYQLQLTEISSVVDTQYQTNPTHLRNLVIIIGPLWVVKFRDHPVLDNNRCHNRLGCTISNNIRNLTIIKAQINNPSQLESTAKPKIFISTFQPIHLTRDRCKINFNSHNNSKCRKCKVQFKEPDLAKYKTVQKIINSNTNM